MENFVRRINKAHRLAENVEEEEVFLKSDLEKVGPSAPFRV